MVAILYKWLMLSFFWTGTNGALKKEMVVMPDAAHPFFVSVTEINHNAAGKTLEVTCKIFVDDLEAALKKQYNAAVDLGAEKEKSRNETFLAQYIGQHLSLKADGKTIALRYLGFEKDKESAYCYFEAAQAVVPKKIEAINSILHNYTADQINIMHVTVNGKRQSTKLNFPAKEAAFQF